MFNFENKLDKVFLELLLFLQNLSLDEGHVIKEIFEFGILVILENYLTHFEEVDTVIIQTTCDMMANFFEFSNSFDDCMFTALLQNQVGNKMLPFICKDYFDDIPESEELQGTVKEVIFTLKQYTFHIVQI